MLMSNADWSRVVEAAYAPANDDTSWAKELVSATTTLFANKPTIQASAIRHDETCTSFQPTIATGALAPVNPEVAGEFLRIFQRMPRVFRAFWYPPSLVTSARSSFEALEGMEREIARMSLERVGASDAVAIVVHPEPGVGLVLNTLQDEPVNLSRQQKSLLTRIALHIETGYRLRLRASDVVMAVVSSDGKLLHREPDAPETASMREHVARIERARTRRVRHDPTALDLWKALVDGRATVVERTEGSRRQYVFVENAPATQAIRAFTRGEVDAVSYATRGLQSKLVAYALGVSEPTVSSRLASAASKVGLVTRMDLVRIAAMLTHDPRSRFERTSLTTSEREVLELVSRGLSNKQIAAIRSRSVRTIANQVAKLLVKAGAPTRRALVARSV